MLKKEAHSVMVIFIGNGYSDPSSNPEQGHFAFDIAVICMEKA